MKLHLKKASLNENSVEQSVFAQHMQLFCMSFQTDLSGIFISVSESFCEFYGYSKHELLGQNVSILTSGKHSPFLFSQMWDSILSGVSWKGELCNLTAEGKKVWVKVHLESIFSENGAMVGFSCVQTDITKLQEKLLKYQNDTSILETTSRMALVGGWIYRVSTEEVSLSRDAMRILGYKSKTISLTEMNNHFFKNSNEFKIFISRILKKCTDEFHFTLDQKKRKTIKVFGKINFGMKSDVVYGAFQDVTSVVQIEQKLVESEAEYRTLVQNTLMVIYKYNDVKSERLDFIADNIIDITGYPAEYFIDSNHLKDIVISEDQNILTRKLPSEGEEQKSFDLEYQLRDSLGNIHWIHDKGVSISKQSGEIQVFGSLIDVTDRKEMEEELVASQEDLADTNSHLEGAIMHANEMVVAAQNSSRVKSEFIANISHELRTPLNAIIGFTELLQSMINEASQQKYLKTIRNSSNMLLSLINEILDFSKIESGKMRVENRNTDLSELLEEVYDLFSLKISEKGLKFRLLYESNIPHYIFIDPERLKQVLANLLTNAVKFTSVGSIEILVSCIRVNEEKCSLTLSVKDTGIGIRKDQQRQVFVAFQQQDGQSTRKYGGTGLGLSISKNLVELMGGRILLESDKDMGSSFVLLFEDLLYKDNSWNDEKPKLLNNRELEANEIEDYFQNLSPQVSQEFILFCQKYLPEEGVLDMESIISFAQRLRIFSANCKVIQLENLAEKISDLCQEFDLTGIEKQMVILRRVVSSKK